MQRSCVVTNRNRTDGGAQQGERNGPRRPRDQRRGDVDPELVQRKRHSPELAKEFAGGSRQFGLERFARLWRSREERIGAPSLTLSLRNWPVGFQAIRELDKTG